MALKGTLTWLCSLAVLSSSAAQIETDPNCKAQTHLFETLSASFENVLECGENLPWSAEQAAVLLSSMKNLTDILHKYHLKDAVKCPDAEVPENGGLACVTVANKHYCKPMCNHGYDFGFLRRSRLYDECSEQTGHKWNTQYIGGNKLAVCNKEQTQVAGAQTAYFPKDQDCWTTLNSSELHDSTIAVFTTELMKQGIQGEAHHASLVCG